jgi:hypothetical protein
VTSWSATRWLHVPRAGQLHRHSNGWFYRGKERSVTAKRLPVAPAGLGKAGKALWKAILGSLASDWRLYERELHLLASACAVRDAIAELEAAVARDGVMTVGSRRQPVLHPALLELRQLRLTEAKLLGGLELFDKQQEETPVVARARRAASVRQARLRAVR